MKWIHNFKWVFLITILIIAGVGAGMISLSISKADPIIDSFKAGDLVLNNTSLEEGRQIIHNYYSDWAKKGALTVVIDEITYTIPYADIDVNFDIDKTMETLISALPDNKLEQYFHDALGESIVTPIFTYNSGKLVRRCEEIFSHYEIEPISGSYRIEEGILKVLSPSLGLDIDYKLLEKDLGTKILSLDELLKINTSNSSIFVKTFNDPIYDENFDTIASMASIQYAPDVKEKLESVFNSFDNVLIKNGDEIKLSSIIDFSQFENDMERDLLNRLASTVYQAALPLDGIKVLNRKPAQRPVSYTKPGLEAVIDGEEADLILKNETGKALLLLVEILNKEFNLYFVSLGSLKTGDIMVEERDFIPPSVITIVNEKMSPNVTRVVSEGVSGFTVSVTRTVDDTIQQISLDEYLPISKTVETGVKSENLGSK